MSPGDPNQGQPTYFYPRRHWGVFAVKVPADFGDKQKVVWTIKVNGQTFSIPGSLREEWQIDALEGEAGSNNTPPALSFDEGGAQGRGPAGITVERTAAVGKPLAITVITKDDGAGAHARRLSRDAHLVHASGSRRGHVRHAVVAAHAHGRHGDDDGDVQQAG